MVKLACIILFLMAFLDGPAQLQLVLIKGNKIIIRFSEGDHIRFQRKGQDFFFNGAITGISQEYIKIGEEDTTYLYQIKCIDMHGLPNTGFKTDEIGSKLVVAGTLLLLIDGLNTSNGSQVGTGVIVVSSVLVGSGTLMLFVNNNYFKIGRKKKVIVMK